MVDLKIKEKHYITTRDISSGKFLCVAIASFFVKECDAKFALLIAMPIERKIYTNFFVFNINFYYFNKKKHNVHGRRLSTAIAAMFCDLENT